MDTLKEDMYAQRERLFGRLSLLRSKVGPECQSLLVSRDLVDGLLAWSGQLMDNNARLEPLALSPPSGAPEQPPQPSVEAAPAVPPHDDNCNVFTCMECGLGPDADTHTAFHPMCETFKPHPCDCERSSPALPAPTPPETVEQLKAAVDAASLALAKFAGHHLPASVWMDWTRTHHEALRDPVSSPAPGAPEAAGPQTNICAQCGNPTPHGPAGCSRTLQKWQRESPEWCVEMLRDTAERLQADAEHDAQHGLDKYRVGALAQRRLNLMAAANAMESLLSSPSPGAVETPEGWQPIETAPKGPQVLVYDDGAIFISLWVDANELGTGWWDNGIVAPTHWMPLPAPPSGGSR